MGGLVMGVMAHKSALRGGETLDMPDLLNRTGLSVARTMQKGA